MPDRDKDTQAARNRDTLLVARVPVGLKPRVQEAAKRAGESVSTFVTAAVEKELQERDSGTTPPAGAPVKRGTTARRPRRTAKPSEAESPSVPAAVFQQPRRHADNCKCLMCKPPKTGDQQR